MRKLLLLIVTALAGCTTLAPGADAVRITRSADSVRSCHPVGYVQSSPPYVMPGDDYKQVRNQAAALGGNAVLITGPRLIHTAGTAYRC